MGSFIDALADLPAPQRDALVAVMDVARRVAPNAIEGVSYGAPALKVRGRPLIGVTASAAHLSLFPFSPAALDAVRSDLDSFVVSKGMIRFTAERPVPAEIVERLVRARLAEIEG